MSHNKYRSAEHTARLVAESGRISDSRGGAFRRTSTSNPDDWRDNHGVDVGAQRNDAHHKAAVAADVESERSKEKTIEKRAKEAEKRNRGVKQLLKSIKEELTPKQKETVAKWPRNKKALAHTDHFFGADNDEINEPLQGGSNKSEPHKAVEAHLGQEISHDDYKAGHTTDKYGRKVKIGALLQKSKAHPDLINQFANDSTRQLKKENKLSVQVTRSAHGVAGQTSGGQSWEDESCKNFENGSNKHYLKDEVKQGTVVAYLRNHYGHELARATFHPHHDKDGNVVHVLNSYYGPKVKEFEDHIKGLAGRLSHPSSPRDSVYTIHPDVYNDRAEKDSIHPGVSEVEHHNLLDHGDKRVRQAAAAHPNATPEHIHKALDDNETQVRVTAAAHPNASVENIIKALQDKDKKVKKAAINHPKVIEKHITKALSDKEDYMRQYAAAHPNATSEHIHKALDDDEQSVRIAAVRNKNATAEHLHRALDDENSDIRETAIDHPNATSEHFKRALKDKDPSIRFQAKKRLQKLNDIDSLHWMRQYLQKEEYNLEERYRKVYKHIPSVFLRLRKKSIKETEEMNEAKKFVFDKPMSSTVKAYSNRDTNELKDMHARWSKDHSNPKNDPITSEKLLAVHHVLKSRGENVELPKHKNLGMHVNEETNTEKRMQIKNVARPGDPSPISKDSTMSKQGSIEKKVMENYGLSKDLVDVTRQILERKSKDEPNDTKKNPNLKMDLGVTPKDHKTAYSKMRDEMGMKDREVTRRLVGEDNSKIAINPDLDTRTDDEGTTPKTAKEKKLAALAHPKDKITHKDVLVGRGALKKEETELDETRGAFVNSAPTVRQVNVRDYGFHVSRSDADNKKAIDSAKRALGARGGNVVGVPDSHKHLMEDEVEFSEERNVSINHAKQLEKKGADVHYRILHNGKDTPHPKFTNYSDAAAAARKYKTEVKKAGYNHHTVDVFGYTKEEVEFSDAELEHINAILGEELELDEDAKKRSDMARVNAGVMTRKEFDVKWGRTPKTIKQKAMNPGGVYTNMIKSMAKEELELDEARGRPKKSGESAEGDDTHKHPIQQLTKIAYAIQGNEPSFEHKDGTKTKITKQLARHITTAYNAMRTSQEKDDFATKLHANRDSMMAAVKTHI